MFTIRNSDARVAGSTHVFHFSCETFYCSIKVVISNHGSSSRVIPEFNKLKSVFLAFNDTAIILSEIFSLPTRPTNISSNGILTRLYNLKMKSTDSLPRFFVIAMSLWNHPYAQHVFNLIPDVFKEAFIILIPKGNQGSCENFSSKSMLPIFSRVLKKIVYRAFVQKIRTNKLICFVPRDC